MDPLSVL